MARISDWQPETTGILGQATSVCAIGGEKLLALHAVRRDTDRPRHICMHC